MPSQMERLEMIPLKTAYLLISPLQGIIKDLATMSLHHHLALPALFSKRPSALSSHTSKLIHHDTLAIFGSTDAFTSSKKLRSWAIKLATLDSDSKFRWKEVAGAGHFWNDSEHVASLRDGIKDFVRSL